MQLSHLLDGNVATCAGRSRLAVTRSTVSMLRQADDDDQLFRPAAADGGNGGEQKGMNRLYGHWQTLPWAPEPATDGRVPKNERGQVDVPPFALALPQGARHRPASSRMSLFV